MDQENKIEKEQKEKSTSAKSKGYSSKTAMVVALRNKFFFVMYRYASLVFVTSILTFITSVSFFLFFSNKPVPPQYIPVNEDGTYIQLLPEADCSSKTEADVKNFTLNAINKIYKYDYINYADQFQDAANYFTIDGWNEYLDSYKISGSLMAIKQNQWIVTVKPQGVPEFVVEPRTNEGVCNWEVKVPIILSYIGKNGNDIRGELFLRISRVSILKSEEGLGIRKMILKELI